MPEFHRAVGIPRSVAVAYPFGRPLGQVGDRDGQRLIVVEALTMLGQAAAPGEIRHMALTWPEEPRKTDWHPPHISPIIKANLDKIKAMKV